MFAGTKFHGSHIFLNINMYKLRLIDM